ncbi:SMP-30/gluconolactonase/LRE family protein [Asticcacaulis sp. ZE23SCel15]|uniref:SMP-30/gluconolactonase/LRE family protein n=1 Tax=Asticcacaulis sp. ZE23SCel15 TaxID=3059027 RepID=UPI00265FC7EE|nr:SMP-30/gluconolactonase/LRE family protein [Asticcacaulis sp. ZE23SCel15]WKL56153.1 SMP-30/gluconolactonase/LRE family protein [Asticcacaulis sp. ZE23SCel15]
MWQPSEIYPDPSIEILDPRFERYRLSLSAVEKLYDGTRWGEGPVWFGDGRYLLWSDIPGNRILRWDEETGAVSLFRKPSDYANGHTRDRQGRLISCQHGSRSVTRTEYDGTITTLMDRFEGKWLNSPNDVTVKSDDSIWFTDPTFGIGGDYEGHRATPELPTHVYRLDPATGEAAVVAADIDHPNGICFSPDETRLYIAESNAKPKRIRVYDVAADGWTLTGGRVFTDCGEGAPDGFRCDEDGNLWCGWGGGVGLNGVRVFAPDGTAIGHIHLPNRCANLCFGGKAKNRLFMVAGQSLFSLYVNTRGV